jgi:hypothetical protein
MGGSEFRDPEKASSRIQKFGALLEHLPAHYTGTGTQFIVILKDSQ